AVELDRLRGIALAEFERRSAPGMTPEAEERLRRELHLDTLSKAERSNWTAYGASPSPSSSAGPPRG
ncbi:hypothetical protein CTI14_69405, partial [Methylobacterium radiotolerans]